METEEKILTLLEQLNSKRDKSDLLLEVMVAEQKRTSQRLDKLEKGLEEVRIELKGEIAQVRDELKGEIAQVKDELNEKIEEVREHVIIIENEHLQKLGAAFDGYELVYGILKNEIRPDIAAIKAREERRDARLYFIESSKVPVKRKKKDNLV
jgi:hypothetical protein